MSLQKQIFKRNKFLVNSQNLTSPVVWKISFENSRGNFILVKGKIYEIILLTINIKIPTK